MRIFALDLGKFKSVACDYEAGVAAAGGDTHRFETVATTPAAVQNLIAYRQHRSHQRERRLGHSWTSVSVKMSDPTDSSAKTSIRLEGVSTEPNDF